MTYRTLAIYRRQIDKVDRVDKPMQFVADSKAAFKSVFVDSVYFVDFVDVSMGVGR